MQSCVVLSVDVASSERGGKNCGLASGLRVLFFKHTKNKNVVLASRLRVKTKKVVWRQG